MKHYEVVAAIIKKDELYFCAQRANKGETGLKWEFPGGKINPNETKEEALIREIKEELTGIISVDKHVATISYTYQSFSITMYVYLCTLVSGDLILNEHINSKWLTKDELIKLDFAPADKMIFDYEF